MDAKLLDYLSKAVVKVDELRAALRTCHASCGGEEIVEEDVVNLHDVLDEIRKEELLETLQARLVALHTGLGGGDDDTTPALVPTPSPRPAAVEEITMADLEEVLVGDDEEGLGLEDLLDNLTPALVPTPRLNLTPRMSPLVITPRTTPVVMPMPPASPRATPSRDARGRFVPERKLSKNRTKNSKAPKWAASGFNVGDQERGRGGMYVIKVKKNGVKYWAPLNPKKKKTGGRRK